MTEIPEHLKRRARWARKAAQLGGSGSEPVTTPPHTDLVADLQESTRILQEVISARRRTDEQWKLAEGYRRMQRQRFRRYGPIVLAVLLIAMFAAFMLAFSSPASHEPTMYTCYTSSDVVVRSTDCNQVEIHLQKIGHA